MTVLSNHGSPKKRLPPPPPRPWTKASFSYSEDGSASGGESDERKSRAKDVSKGLEKIYLGDGKQDLSKLDHAKPHRIRRFFLWLLTLCALTSALAWAGLVWLQPNAEIDSAGLEIKIDGPTNVTLGQEHSFVVSYRNRSFQPIADTELRLSWPADFQVSYTDPWPTDTQNNAWKFGWLAPGAEGKITVRGIFLGQLGAKSTFQAIGTFRPSGETRVRQSLATDALEYGASVFAGGWTVPSKVVAGDQVPVSFDIANQGTQALSGLRAHLDFPAGFLPSASTGTQLIPTNTPQEWEMVLPTLEPGTTSTIRLSGSFVSGSSGDLSFKAGIGRLSGQNFITLFTSETHIPVLAGDLSLHLVANGSDADRSIGPGDPLRLAIAYKNVSPEALGGISIILNVESLVNGKSTTGTTLIDWKALQDSMHGVTSTKPRMQTIRYDKDVIPELDKLDPGQEGTIEVTLPTLSSTSGMHDALISMDVAGFVATVGKDKVNRTLHANPIHARYRSDADLHVAARYYTEEGAPLGTGPLPPVSGKTTVYRLEWTIDKTLHALDKLDVTTVLPDNAVWNGQGLADAGDIVYEEKTRTVHWTLNKMPDDVSELVARFDIALTPADLDIGRFARLLGESHFTATDSATTEQIQKNKPAITTDLQEDEGARGKGVVRKP